MKICGLLLPWVAHDCTVRVSVRVNIFSTSLSTVMMSFRYQSFAVGPVLHGDVPKWRISRTRMFVEMKAL